MGHPKAFFGIKARPPALCGNESLLLLSVPSCFCPSPPSSFVGARYIVTLCRRRPSQPVILNGAVQLFLPLRSCEALDCAVKNLSCFCPSLSSFVGHDKLCPAVDPRIGCPIRGF